MTSYIVRLGICDENSDEKDKKDHLQGSSFRTTLVRDHEGAGEDWNEGGLNGIAVRNEVFWAAASSNEMQRTGASTTDKNRSDEVDDLT